MNQDDEDVSDLEGRRLCYECIGEAYLKDEVKTTGELGECSHCGDSRESVSLKELAERIHPVFEEHFYVTSSEPGIYESMMMRDPEGAYEWEREGSQTQYAIAEAAGIDEEAAEHVRRILEEQHCDRDAVMAGEESPYDAESFYEEKGPQDDELRAAWSYFEKSLKTESRLFNRGAESVLTRMFEDLSQHKTRDGNAIIVDAGPGHPISALFRGRVFHPADHEKLQTALQRPDIELGPPPPHAAMPGRMNSRGISVFYGSTEAQTALAEVRPPVGSVVAVARFDITRPVRLLDVEAFRAIFVTGSIFDNTYMKRLEKARFLKGLSDRITVPVMPGDELSDYLVTQAIADYLANLDNPALDGLIYSSVQDGPGVNVALFQKSSRVAELDLPQKTRIWASLGTTTDEGHEIDYRVWEEVPPQGEEKKPKDAEWSFDVDLFTHPYDPNADTRQATLRLDTQNVAVHHVGRARYESTGYEVSRHRMERSGQEENDF
ncbi:MAG TPA: RES family NAD+ phosphorylase [Steroidobacteraceae bacterium]|jgi:hypothetical protein